MTPDIPGGEMEDLIARLSAATGPDRELDWAIVQWIFPDAQLSYPEGWDDPIVYHAAPLVRSKDTLPRFTESMDAAITLVPSEWMWDVASSGAAWVMPDNNLDGQIVIGGIRSPAIALCIASLKARKQP